ncbi:LysM peptidoglycan-binding domain-containing protein [Peribacillus tepidiphilus]|uniref:C40 family peptidase n=1 Tax=Peribacillus tepidiphilus TaxID=2652445 RepID=UPI001292775E|nr:C40 family peptidase [Peribacillus tepidiphilus]
MRKRTAVLSTAAILSATFVTPAMASTYKSNIAKNHINSVELNKQSSHKINQISKVSGANQFSASKSNTVILSSTKTATYTVVSGDTLIKIANKHNITLAELQAWNNMKDHLIYPGQKLIVAKSTNSSTAVLPQPVTETKSTPNTNTSPSTTVNSTKVYVVKKGDSLWKISNTFGTTVQQIYILNNLKSEALKIGQTLKIPVSEKEKILSPNGNSATSPTVDRQSQNTIVEEAKKLMGIPYSWAGSSPTGFDCSGFIYYVYKKVGYQIPRLSAATYFDLGKPVSNPLPGDAIFFYSNPNNPFLITHMGIYLGNNQFIHASSSKGVTISSVEESYYKLRFAGYKRF